MFNKNNGSVELTHDLSKLLKEEGSFVKELSDVATKAAEFHARLESIEKAIGSDPSAYNCKQADQLVLKAKDKYSEELEGRMKDQAYDQIQNSDY
ncbi:MAG: hypothetical protein Q4F95_03355 [Oscillospiraceae bacterium]|nr:hypothetical protein [Oscillospiraceae bacterium]